MAKTNQIKKLVNGEIADADDVNQIVENAGAEGGSIPYDETTHQRDTAGDENLGSANYPWADIFVNKDAYLREVTTGSASVSASVSFSNLRKLIYLKDLFTTYQNSWSGHAGQFLRVRLGEDGVEPAAPTNVQIFTSSGTFNVPAGITKVYVTMIGGGGGGSTNSPGGGGGSGKYLINYPVTVTGGGSETVTIGAGGAVGSDGGDTSFGTVTAEGGKAGATTNGGAGGGSTPSSGRTARPYGIPGSSGYNSAASDGGAGGSSPFGKGGDGSANSSNNATAGGANTGAGGGGHGGQVSDDAKAGGSGLVIVMY